MHTNQPVEPYAKDVSKVTGVTLCTLRNLTKVLIVEVLND
jgi:hypothetical protein